jgi:hypothetical protein
LNAIDAMVNSSSSVVCDAALFHPFFWNDWKVANFLEAIQEVLNSDDFDLEILQTSREAVAEFISLVSVCFVL